MKLRAYRRGRVGWSVTLTTKRYLRTLWLDRARLTKLATASNEPTSASSEPTSASSEQFDG